MCCVTTDGDSGTGFTSTCESAVSFTTAMGVGLQCRAASGCPTDQVCCLYGMSSSCGDIRTATSNCYGGGTQLCDPNAPYGECTGNNGPTTCMAGGIGGKLPMDIGIWH